MADNLDRQRLHLFLLLLSLADTNSEKQTRGDESSWPTSSLELAELRGERERERGEKRNEEEEEKKKKL